MRYLRFLGPLVFLSACSGPAAPDAAVCQDVVIRLCQTASCPGVGTELAPGTDCVLSLQERTGCGGVDFTFTSPTRERFLDCRELLLSNGTSTEQPPACDDTLRFLFECPDVAGFFQGGQP
ncbi:hypothetical protein [Pyxidicoccus trucidator]|uniref:hypothetical protein n=1 Tax=Pyxidicoccus trucidator TaxID=2709662 RepID=UPI001F073841|nr:hypothetical protein [Pyxidicoccus trucidator]